MTAEDDWDEMPPADIALALAWPLGKDDQHTMHKNECAIFAEEGGCNCNAVKVFGPTAFA